MVPDYAIKGDMFKGFRSAKVFDEFKNGKERGTIFGNDIPQVAKSKPDPSSSACCVLHNGGQIPSGGFNMNAFYSTIWSKNLRNVLISNPAFGDRCCNDK